MRVFEMAPGGGRAAGIVLVLTLFLLAAVAALLFAAMRSPKFEVSEAGLRIRGNIYGRVIPIEQLRLEQARVVDLQSAPELRPRWRTNGSSLPGLKAGWFRLENGEKSLLFLSRGTRAAYIPTTAGYSLLLSPSEPEAMLDTLRAQRR